MGLWGEKSSMKVRPVAGLLLTLFFLIVVFTGTIKLLTIFPGKGATSIFVSVIVVAAALLAFLRKISLDGFLAILLVSTAFFMTQLISALSITYLARYLLIFAAATVCYVVALGWSLQFGYRSFMFPALLTFLIIALSELWQYVFPDDYHSFAQVLLTDDAFRENFNWYLAGKISGLAGLPGVAFLCLMLLGSVLMASLIQKNGNRVGYPVVGWVLFCLLAAGAWLSGSRAALISFCVWCIFGFYAIFFGRRTSRFSKALFTLTLFVVVPVAVYQLFLIFQEQSRWLTIYSRFDYWKTALELFARYPLTGIGVNNYLYYAESVGGISIFSEITYVHNIWLQVLAETGFVGTVVFLIGVLLCARNNFLCVKIAHRYREYNLLFLVGATCAFGIYTLTSNPFYDRQPLMLFLALQGIVNGQLARIGVWKVYSFGKAAQRGIYPHTQLERLAGYNRVPGVGSAVDLSQLPYRGHRQRLY
ncbi:MAG: O-antigen ligase family protein [Ammonifex sp.]|jgi:O-antigen ligase|nr:MAG: O-antigen ligase family protein [Ammonifex sp.]